VFCLPVKWAQVVAFGEIASVAAPRSYEVIENERLEALNPPENWIVGQERCGVAVDSGCGLQSIGGSQSMQGANLGREVGDFKRRRNPLEIRVGREQCVVCIGAFLVRFPIGLNQ
jgi:hypothetical protein